MDLNLDNLADRITDRLMTNYSGDKADRLVLMQDQPKQRDLGGMNRDCVRREVLAALNESTVYSSKSAAEASLASAAAAVQGGEVGDV